MVLEQTRRLEHGHRVGTGTDQRRDRVRRVLGEVRAHRGFDLTELGLRRGVVRGAGETTEREHTDNGEDAEDWRDILAQPELCLHLYGKLEIRPDRKMGHVTRIFPESPAAD